MIQRNFSRESPSRTFGPTSQVPGPDQIADTNQMALVPVVGGGKGAHERLMSADERMRRKMAERAEARKRQRAAILGDISAAMNSRPGSRSTSRSTSPTGGGGGSGGGAAIPLSYYRSNSENPAASSFGAAAASSYSGGGGGALGGGGRLSRPP